MPANLENSAVATGLEKVSFHSNPKERQCQGISSYCIIAFISHASKVTLKILQARLQQYMNRGLPDDQAGFRKGRGTKDQIANLRLYDYRKSKRVPEKHLLLLYRLCQSLWLCGSQQTEKFLKEIGISDHLTCLLRNLYAGQEATVRTGNNSLEQ